MTTYIKLIKTYIKPITTYIKHIKTYITPITTYIFPLQRRFNAFKNCLKGPVNRPVSRAVRKLAKTPNECIEYVLIGV